MLAWDQRCFDHTARAVLVFLVLKRRFGIKNGIQLQWDFLFLQPFRAVWLAESVFLHPSGAVWLVGRENVIQLQWDFRFCQPSAAKWLFLRSEF